MLKVPQVNKSAYVKPAWEPDPLFILLVCVLANIPRGILPLSRLRNDSKIKTAALPRGRNRSLGGDCATPCSGSGPTVVGVSSALRFVTLHI